jgi:hypothetical protein
MSKVWMIAAAAVVPAIVAVVLGIAIACGGTVPSNSNAGCQHSNTPYHVGYCVTHSR